MGSNYSVDKILEDSELVKNADGEKKVLEAKVKVLNQIARIAETAERFEDMCVVMGKMVELKKGASMSLQIEERNMLSVAYKNVVGNRRTSWRTLKNESENPSDTKTFGEYKAVVESELEAKCNEILTVLKDNLVDEGKTDLENGEWNKDDFKAGEEISEIENQVFYLKMCGDYYRYLAEFSENEEYKSAAEKNYKTALKIAEKFLAPTHPTRLGLALNASVCFWEILNKQKEACKLAKDSFDNAIQKLDALNDSTYKDSTLIMQLLRDNLTIWTSEEKTGQNESVEERED